MSPGSKCTVVLFLPATLRSAAVENAFTLREQGISQLNICSFCWAWEEIPEAFSVQGFEGFNGCFRIRLASLEALHRQPLKGSIGNVIDKLNSQKHCFGFCRIWELGGSPYVKNDATRCTNILPARPANLEDFVFYCVVGIWVILGINLRSGIHQQNSKKQTIVKTDLRNKHIIW